MALIEYAAAGGIVVEADQMLLLDRPLRGEIRLPKGHIEPGESPSLTALRETSEEAGLAGLEIVADLGERVVEFDYKSDHYRRREHFYLMRKVSDQKFSRPPHDEEDFRPFWVALSNVVDLLTYESEKQWAQQAIEVYRALQMGRSDSATR